MFALVAVDVRTSSGLRMLAVAHSHM